MMTMEKAVETITYEIKFIDSCRSMPPKLSNLVDNLSEINNKNCKACLERKNIKSECEFIELKNNRLNYRCKEYNGTSNKSINNLIEKFPRMYKICNGNLNRFVMLLRKGVYPYEYNYVKPKYNDKAKLCYMDTDSFVINIFAEDFSENISNDVKRWFDASNYDKNDKRLL